jgi:rare lipoprotein A
VTARAILAGAALAALAAGCAHPPTPARGGIEEGLASFYADRFEGRPTASGEPYSGQAFTCAHRTQPFGAWLRVTDVETGRSVEVRVNDRGPHVAGRVVDLSRAAARAIGLEQRGLARVQVVRIR